MMDFYNENPDFKRFVDRYAAKEKKPFEVVLTHAVVISYAGYLKDRGKDEPKLTNMWGQGAGAAHDNVSGV